MTRSETVADAIRRFPFDDYGLDDISYLLEETPDTQEWVPRLAEAILAALDEQKEPPVMASDDNATV